MIKPWYQSKTIWLNIAAATLVGIEAATGALRPVFGENNFYVVIVGGLSVANMILRGMTNQSIGKSTDTESK